MTVYAPDGTPQRVIEREYERDELSAQAEYGATFRTDVEALVSSDVVDAAIEPGRYELPPVPGVRYTGFTDPSGGSADSFTLAIAHKHAATVVLDAPGTGDAVLPALSRRVGDHPRRGNPGALCRRNRRDGSGLAPR